MNCSKTITISDHVLHNQYKGDVTSAFILEAIDQWVQLIRENDIKFLLFDYTDANMDLLVPNDAKEIAQNTQKLIIENPFIKLIGVMPNESDYSITNIWSAFSTQSGSIVEFENIYITKSLHEAMYIVQSKQ